MSVPKNRKATIIKALRKCGCDEERLKILMPSIENLIWLEQKMDQGRSLIASSAIVIPYDNGGGQKGVRKNPAFEAIHRMTASYNACLKTIVDSCMVVQPMNDNVSTPNDILKQKRDIITSLRQTEVRRGGDDGE